MLKHPELGTKVDNLYRRVSAGDESAYAFLCVFDEYFEDVSAFVADSTAHNQARFVEMLARTNTTYSLPFFVRNGHFLWQPIQQMFDSMAFDPSPVCLAAVVLAVANIKLGFIEARKLSGELRECALACRKLAKPAGKE